MTIESEVTEANVEHFLWTILVEAFGKYAVSCGPWKSSSEKAAVEKTEDRLVKAAVEL